VSSLNVEDLPEGWTSARVDKVCDVNPRLNKSEILDDLLVSFVPMSAVGAGDGSIDVSKERPASEVKKGFTAFKQGDVLFAKITPCMENGKMVVVPKVANGYGFGSTEFHVLRPKEGIDARYVYYFVSSQNFRGVAERYMTGAVGQKRVSTTYLKEQLIPVAPPEQQKRIVAEIEKQFSRLDEAVTNLKRVKANLKRYKAAVLKAAVEGKLTEEWRKQHPDVEHADKLLERILAERRENWQGRGKYKEPAAPDTTDLPELPEGWVWASLEQLITKLTSGSRDWAPYYGRGDSIFVLAQNVRPMRPDYTVTQLVDPPEEDPACARSLINVDDLLVTIVGANAGQFCRVDRVPGKAYVCQSVALARPLFRAMAEYLNYYFNSQENGQKYFDKCMYGQGRPHLSFDQLKAAPISIPPFDEMERVVVEAECALSIVARAEAQVDINLRRSDRLRQSILKRAFSGDLTILKEVQ